MLKDMETCKHLEPADLEGTDSDKNEQDLHKVASKLCALTTDK